MNDDKIKELVAFGKKNGGILELSQLNEILNTSKLGSSDVERLYDLLEKEGIVVLDLSLEKDLAAEDDDLEGAPEDIEAAEEELDLALSDDPVKMYLKEIGN